MGNVELIVRLARDNILSTDIISQHSRNILVLVFFICRFSSPFLCDRPYWFMQLGQHGMMFDDHLFIHRVIHRCCVRGRWDWTFFLFPTSDGTATNKNDLAVLQRIDPFPTLYDPLATVGLICSSIRLVNGEIKKAHHILPLICRNQPVHYL